MGAARVDCRHMRHTAQPRAAEAGEPDPLALDKTNDRDQYCPRSDGRLSGGQLPSLLTRGSRRPETTDTTRIVQFGPCTNLSGGRLTFGSGPLAGTSLLVESRTSDTRADFRFYESEPVATTDPVAHCHFDRDSDTGMETLWSIFIHGKYRRRGLTTALARLTFRELLCTGGRHWFAVRKLMQVDTEGRSLGQGPGSARADNPQTPRRSLHNLGLGLVALRLGLRPAKDAELLLSSDKVRAIHLIPPDPPDPPGLLIRLQVLPGLLVAVLVDPETGKPASDPSAYQRFVNPRQLLMDAQSGKAVIGNIDYVLTPTAIESFAARLANDGDELERFTASLRRGVPN